jgi:HEPN domain-containing protein
MRKNIDVAKGWILKAENDIFALKTIMETGKALDTACFHAQQAAEKYLKAFLCFNGINFSKTHNIEELMNLCANVNKLFSGLIKETVFLTEYAVDIRYDFDFLPDKDETENALKSVNKIKQLALSLLPKELHP